MTSEMILGEDREEESRTHITEKQKGKAEKGRVTTLSLTSWGTVWNTATKFTFRGWAVLLTTGGRLSHKKHRVSSLALEAAQGFGVCGGLAQEKTSAELLPIIGSGMARRHFKRGPIVRDCSNLGICKQQVIRRLGAWGHTVVMSGCIDWGTSRVEQVQACPTYSPQNPLGSSVVSSMLRKEVSKVMEYLFNEITVQNDPKLEKEIDIQVQETLRIPNTCLGRLSTLYQSSNARQKAQWVTR